jgi:hypothetical protein
VLALADPGDTLAALITVGGIWGVAVGVSRIVMSFEIKRLPHDVDKAFSIPANGASSRSSHAATGQPVPAGS